MNPAQVTVVQTDVLDHILNEISALRQEVQRPVQKRWYTLHEAAELKGISFDVLRKLPRWHRPNYGRSTCLISGSRKYNEAYRAEDVMVWLEKTEDQLEEEYWEILEHEKAPVASRGRSIGVAEAKERNRRVADD